VNKRIAVIIPHKGLGDIIFHYSFINSISKHHKKKIILFANKSSKADQIYRNNKLVEKIKIMDLKRPNLLFYIFKIFQITVILYSYKPDIIYYTGNNNWHKISFKLLSLFKSFELHYFTNKKKYIIDFLNYFLKRKKIKNLNNYEFKITNRNNTKFIKKIKSYKKPWVFLSIDTSEDQIRIPNKILERIIFKLKKKYKTIFINTNKKNKKKLNLYKDKVLVETSNYNILEINQILRNSQIFIGTESGPANLAAINKIKSYIFFSNKIKIESKLLPNKYLRKYFNIKNIEKNIKSLLNII
tara:strand:- start:222 stop:1118 length:897 start_codon:yes stop_codon:yes gene_type:complete